MSSKATTKASQSALSLPRQSAERLRVWGLGLFLVCAVIFAYQPAWNAGFIWDDDDYVTHNPLLTAPDGLKRMWFSLDSPSQYFPLTYTTFRLERSLWGLNPKGYHWVNILLHSVNALLAWRLLSRLKIPGAWLAAAIFALHPVNVESVAWITQLKNTQSLFFCLLALLAWVEFVDKRRGWWFYALTLLFYALALFSKTTACTLPAALLLILWLKKTPVNWPRVFQIVPFVALGVAMGMVSMWWERHHQGTVGDTYSMSLLERVLVASRAIWFYVGKLLLPVNLSFNYPLWKINPANVLAYLWLIASVIICIAIFFARRFFGRSIEVAAIFYVATLGPLLGFVMLYTFRYTFVADHYQYMATLGPIALVAAGIAWKSNRATNSFGFARLTLCGVLLLTLGVLTWRQSRMYADLETLWQTTITRNPDSFMAHNNLGAIFLGQGRVDGAIASFNRALEIQPDHANAHGNLGNALLQKGRVDEAVEHFQRALDIEPHVAKAHSDLGFALAQKGRTGEAIVRCEKAVELDPKFAEGHNNLGVILLRAGQLNEAATHFEAAVKLQPDHVDARYNLANCLFQNGRIEDSLPHFQRVLELQPDNVEVLNNFGWALLQAGRADEAIARFQSVLKLQPDIEQTQSNLAIALLRAGRAREAVAQYEAFIQRQPDHAQALADLAWVLATWPDAAIRNGTRAIDLAEHAVRLSGVQDPMMLRSLAAAYAESGQFAEAMATARRALQLAVSSSNTTLAEALQSQLKSYESGTPFRDSETTKVSQTHPTTTGVENSGQASNTRQSP